MRFGRGVLRRNPALVILDEPFRGLARDQRAALLARARRRWSDATLLCVTHDIGETERFARVLVVADGQIVEDGAPDALRARPGSRYAALLAAEAARARVVVVRGGVAAAAARARPSGRGWGVTRGGVHRELPVAARPARRADRARRGRRGRRRARPRRALRVELRRRRAGAERAGRVRPRRPSCAWARGRGRCSASSRHVDGGVRVVGPRRPARGVRRGGAGRLPARARRSRGARRHRGDRRARRRRGGATTGRRGCAAARVAGQPSGSPKGSACAPRVLRCGRRCGTPGSGGRMAAALGGLPRAARAGGRPVVDGGRARGGARLTRRAARSRSSPAIIAALVGVRLVSSWIAGRLAIDGGRVLRDRLLHGLLALDTESTRAEGIGQLLGRVVETEALESLALGGGLMAAAGAFELVTGAVVLGLGIAPGWQLPLLGAWCGGCGRCSPRAVSARSRAGRRSGSRSPTISSSGWSDSGRWSRSRRRRCGTSSRRRRSPRYARTGRALDRAVAVARRRRSRAAG